MPFCCLGALLRQMAPSDAPAPPASAVADEPALHTRTRAALRRSSPPTRWRFLRAHQQNREHLRARRENAARVRAVSLTVPSPPPEPPRVRLAHAPLVGPTAAAVAALADDPLPSERPGYSACSDVEARNADAPRAPSKLYPIAMVCPITLEVFRDPVVAADGHSYERAALQRWLGTRVTSPVTGAPLATCSTMPNHSLRAAIDELTLCLLRRSPTVHVE